jgi:hypothetical protein
MRTSLAGGYNRASLQALAPPNADRAPDPLRHIPEASGSPPVRGELHGARPRPAGPAVRAAGLDPGQLSHSRFRAPCGHHQGAKRPARSPARQAGQAHLERRPRAGFAQRHHGGVRLGSVGTRRASGHHPCVLQRGERVPARTGTGDTSVRGPSPATQRRALSWLARGDGDEANGCADARVRYLQGRQLRRADRPSGSASANPTSACSANPHRWTGTHSS